MKLKSCFSTLDKISFETRMRSLKARSVLFSSSFPVLSDSARRAGLTATGPGWDESGNKAVCWAAGEIAIKVGLGSVILTKPLFPQQGVLPPTKRLQWWQPGPWFSVLWAPKPVCLFRFVFFFSGLLRHSREIIYGDPIWKKQIYYPKNRSVCNNS